MPPLPVSDLLSAIAALLGIALAWLTVTAIYLAVSSLVPLPTPPLCHRQPWSNCCELRVDFLVPGTVTRPLIIRALNAHRAALLPAHGSTPPRIAVFNRLSPSHRIVAQPDAGACVTAFASSAEFLEPIASENEAALLVTLPPGRYVAVITGVSLAEPSALIEVQSLTAAPAPFASSAVRLPPSPVPVAPHRAPRRAAPVA